ncbi:hypothetical protein J6590_001723 [Homalodisca vitripennis]|nr:hypothetical protein J6590_001723 [Homalodisca vitripennis]
MLKKKQRCIHITHPSSHNPIDREISASNRPEAVYLYGGEPCSNSQTHVPEPDPPPLTNCPLAIKETENNLTRSFISGLSGQESSLISSYSPDLTPRSHPSHASLETRDFAFTLRRYQLSSFLVHKTLDSTSARFPSLTNGSQWKGALFIFFLKRGC